MSLQVSVLGHRTLELALGDGGPHVGHGPCFHLRLGLDTPGAHVWQKQHVRVGDEARVHLGLFFVDVESGRGDVAGFESLDQSGFVHDGATGCVDYHDTLLHLFEFFCADDVAGLGLLQMSTYALTSAEQKGPEESRSWNLR